MWAVTYTTYLGGIESLACRRFTTKARATTFAKQVNGTLEKRSFK
jgi:hypothetical protein